MVCFPEWTEMGRLVSVLLRAGSDVAAPPRLGEAASLCR